MKLNILPDPLKCVNVPGGVNSVVVDHAVGFLAAGYEIGAKNSSINIVHALAHHEEIDVFHSHGFYPIGPGYFDQSYSKANDALLQNALKAKVIVCISEFSANILRHKLHIDPIVTRNGIWVKDYKRGGSPSGPILFPKAALDANAKPDDALWLKKSSKHAMLSIAKIPGIKSTGKMNRQKFLDTLRECSIYLGTTKENNSMASMEAMITGVPVVGYDTGFNSEWLVNGVGCELVPRGDQVALKEAIEKVKNNWRKYSVAARDFAEIFDWQPVIDELLEIYQNINNAPKTKIVSIVIPCHNYARWVGEAIESAIAQSLPCEIIVVDDKSTDEGREIIQRYPVKLIKNSVNLGVAETRNKGIRAATGEYIVCLDADDKLHPDFAEQHLAAMQSRDVAVTYAPIALVNENGIARRQMMFTANAAPELQAVGKNQIPSCCMFRKEFWKRSGGYDGKYSPAEDAHFWLKIFQLGGSAVKVSDKPLMDYRIHGDSLSAKGFPSWWLGSKIDFNSSIQERDPETTVVIEDHQNAKEVLWLLEQQKYQKWDCQMERPNGLKETFPWLNRSRPQENKNLLHLKALPSRSFLDEYVTQTPEWIAGSPAK